MVHKGRYTKSTGGISKKAVYLPKDNKRVKTLKILKARGKMNQNRLMHSVGLTRSQWAKYDARLNEMIEWGWLNKDPSTEYKGGTIYSLTKVGSNLADFFNEIYNKQPDELSKLEIFSEYQITGQD